ncbi:uncharacterized protein LOC143281302 [Babylonia areolata]|uniref:uncharacterized protein LOC143281302 n=1 Tax=Babylonia areolata TaxID=304850 RepID=UPI003FD47A4B
MVPLVLALLPAMAVGSLLMMPGETTDSTVSATYEPVVFAVKAINQQFARSNGWSEELSLVKIVRARKQVVAGELLSLTLQLTGANLCELTVWHRPWLQDPRRSIITAGPTCERKKLLTSSGQGAGSSRGAARRLLPGGAIGGVSDPQPLPGKWQAGHAAVRGALSFAACAINDRSNSLFATAMAHTQGVTYTKQLTSGMTYRFYNVPMVTTDCRYEGCAKLDLSACSDRVRSGQQTKKCNFEVQYQAWMAPQFTLIDTTC